MIRSKPKDFCRLSEWFVFETEVDYDKYDFLSKNYTKIVKYDIKQFIAPELVHDVMQHDLVLGDEGIPMDRTQRHGCKRPIEKTI